MANADIHGHSYTRKRGGLGVRGWWDSKLYNASSKKETITIQILVKY